LRKQADRHSGFGTDALKKIVAHELGREVTLDFAPEGLCCTLFVPVRDVPAFDPVTAPGTATRSNERVRA